MEDKKILTINKADGSTEEVEEVISFEKKKKKKRYLVYTKNEGSVYHLSLDFESGGFEVFDKNYVHMGQYNFSCTIAKKAQPMTHRLIH